MQLKQPPAVQEDTRIQGYTVTCYSLASVFNLVGACAVSESSFWLTLSPYLAQHSHKAFLPAL
nr:hypothetical protein Q903MT_gene3239 [Picea sitchensis]